MLGKALLVAMAAAIVCAVAPARAFDGNDRILPVDNYQHLPANEYAADYLYTRPVFYAPPRVHRPKRHVVGYGYRRRDHEVEFAPPQRSTKFPGRNVVRPATGGPEFVREDVPAPTPPKLERSADQPLVVARYSPRRDVTCQQRTSAGLKLPRAGQAWARWSARNAWRKLVTERYGPLYAGLSFARGERYDCDPGIAAKCEFSAIPCRPVS
jgi:hypothetical protein